MRKVITVFFLCLLLAACAGKEEKEVVKFVKDYDGILQKAYEKGDLNLLAPLTGEGELRKLFPVFQAMKAANSVMITRIKKFRVKDVRLAPDGGAAIVETYEEWEYWWEDRNTKRMTKKKYTEKYPMRYYIVRDKGSWKVDHLELVEGKK